MSRKSIKVFNGVVKRKTVLIVYIFIQMLLCFFAFRTVSKYEYNTTEHIFILLALSYSFIAYLVILLNNENKGMVYYYSASTLLLSFFIVVDLGYLKYTDIRNYAYIQIMVLFIMLDITLNILAQNINKRIFYRYIILLLWILSVVFSTVKMNVYIFIYQITFLIISIYPITFLIYNYKNIKRYGRHLIPTFLLIISLNIIFLLLQFIMPQKGEGLYNYELYIYLNLIEIFLSYLILSSLKFWDLVRDKKSNITISMVINIIFIISALYYIKYNKTDLNLIIVSLLSFFIILKESQLLDHYIKLKSNRINSESNKLVLPGLLENILEISILEYKKEEIYKEQVADFLHDEILQDVIYIKKELEDNYKIPKDEKILKVTDKIINTTRGQMSLYKPYIDYEISLSENYYNLIQSLKRRFGNYNILIDFICDDKLFLSPPYDLIIYRMIYELVTNIFKHSKGDFSVVELMVENGVIFLIITNYGDYLKNENIRNTNNMGLKIIKREVDRFGGSLDINSSIDLNIVDNSDTFDESTVNIKIKIPIMGGITYEYFINR